MNHVSERRTSGNAGGVTLSIIPSRRVAPLSAATVRDLVAVVDVSGRTDERTDGWTDLAARRRLFWIRDKNGGGGGKQPFFSRPGLNFYSPSASPEGENSVI